MFKVYADTNIYSRLFDDRSNERVRSEAYACGILFEYAKKGEIELIGSDMLDYEIRNGPISKRTYTRSLFKLCDQVLAYSDDIYNSARCIMEYSGVRAKDAVHLAFAVEGGCRILCYL